MLELTALAEGVASRQCGCAWMYFEKGNLPLELQFDLHAAAPGVVACRKVAWPADAPRRFVNYLLPLSIQPAVR